MSLVRSSLRVTPLGTGRFHRLNLRIPVHHYFIVLQIDRGKVRLSHRRYWSQPAECITELSADSINLLLKSDDFQLLSAEILNDWEKEFKTLITRRNAFLF